MPINLIDAAQPTQVLVEYALTRGPGVRELEGLFRAVEAARDSNYGWSHWMPSIEVSVIEGGYRVVADRTRFYLDQPLRCRRAPEMEPERIRLRQAAPPSS